MGLQPLGTTQNLQTFSIPPVFSLSLTVPNCLILLLFAAINETLGSIDALRSLSPLEKSLEYIPIGNKLAQALESSLNLCVSCLHEPY